MNKKIFLMGVVLLGFLCSNALSAHSGLDTQELQWSMKSPVQEVEKLNINKEISALLQAKEEYDNTLNTAGDDKKKVETAAQHFNNKKEEIFNDLANRRRAQYEQIRFEVTCLGHAWVMGKKYDRRYYLDVDFRIDCPKADEWMLIPGSCYWVENEVKIRQDGGFYKVRDQREENNGYTVHISMKGPDWNRPKNFIKLTLYALYRYNDATIIKLVNDDMVILQKRIEEGINK